MFRIGLLIIRKVAGVTYSLGKAYLPLVTLTVVGGNEVEEKSMGTVEEAIARSLQFDELEELLRAIIKHIKAQASGVFQTYFDELLFDNMIESIREDVYSGIMSAREGFSAVVAVIRYLIDPKTSCFKDKCILYGLMELINSLEYRVLTDNNYNPEIDVHVERNPKNTTFHNLKIPKPAPYGFEGGAIFVASLAMLKEANVFLEPLLGGKSDVAGSLK